MQVNGTQLAAGCKDGTVISWSYPSGEIFFQMNDHKEPAYGIKWNPFREDVFAARHGVRIAFRFSISFYLNAERKTLTSLISFSYFLSHFTVQREVAVVEYASERRRHKGRSF